MESFWIKQVKYTNISSIGSKFVVQRDCYL